MNTQRLSLDAVVNCLQEIGSELCVRAAVHAFGEFGELKEGHFFDDLRVMQVALKHHEEVRK